jgi:predicted glycoside hydrolase/deacetylase ChbG (UPF0249 family)
VEQSAVRLIVNADDLGMSDGVNAGILEAHGRGIVTSASLMVLRPAAVGAVAALAGAASLSVGLHLEIEGSVDVGAAERQCLEQLAAFRRLLAREPTHVDSHHHVHMMEPVATAARRLAGALGVPLRGETIRYEGGFFARTAAGEPWPEGIAVERLVGLVEGLPPGWTELGCHPGIGVKEESSYGPEREEELRALCDPRVGAAVASAGVALRSFLQVC